MGCHVNITKDKYPAQGTSVGKEVKVCFHYDTSEWFRGVCIRDDIEEPYVTVIQLVEDGSVILANECQYQLM